LITFNCSENNLTALPSNMNFPKLTHFFCSYNYLTTLACDMILPIPGSTY